VLRIMDNRDPCNGSNGHGMDKSLIVDNIFVDSTTGEDPFDLSSENSVPVVASTKENEITLRKKQILTSLSSLSLSDHEQLPVLGYWKIRGFAQPIRLLLAYLQISFQDKWYEIGEDLSRESWLKEKFTLGLDLPNLPYWICKESGIKLTQSRAIMRHLAREHDPTLLGTTADEQRRVDMLENHIWDCWLALVSVCFRYTEKDKGFLNSLPIQFEVLSNFIGDNEWCISNHITFVDFMVYEALYQHRVFDSNCLNNYPKLLRILNQFKTIPAIADYMRSPNFIKRPLYTRLAKHYI